MNGQQLARSIYLNMPMHEAGFPQPLSLPTYLEVQVGRHGHREGWADSTRLCPQLLQREGWGRPGTGNSPTGPRVCAQHCMKLLVLLHHDMAHTVTDRAGVTADGCGTAGSRTSPAHPSPSRGPEGSPPVEVDGSAVLLLLLLLLLSLTAIPS
jgi:hypothetical protein